MKTRTTFFTGIEFIDLPKLVGKGDTFLDVYHITNDKHQIADIVGPCRPEIGSIEHDYLTKQADGLIYRRTDQNFDKNNLSSELDRLVTEDMKAVKSLGFSLWLIKDNAMRFDRAWITTPAGNGTIHCNTWEANPTCSNGQSQRVKYSTEELREARLRKPHILVHLPKSNEPEIVGPATLLASDSLRFERFYYFIDAARGTPDVALKIAQYCSALEALVSSSHSELTHQVSERVAAALACPGHTRIAIFKTVKRAYNYRSKAVHGSSFKTSEANDLRVAAHEIDDICRKMVKLYEKNDAFRAALTSSTMDEFFLSKLLGESNET